MGIKSLFKKATHGVKESIGMDSDDDLGLDAEVEASGGDEADDLGLDEPEEEDSEEMSEMSATLVVDGYWRGEAPKKAIRKEKSRKVEVLKDW